MSNYNPDNLKKLTACNADNEWQIEQMVNTAMSAYVGWKTAEVEFAGLGRIPMAKMQARLKSEYNTTVRCIGLFVEEPTSYIENHVIDRCRAEFGI